MLEVILGQVTGLVILFIGFAVYHRWENKRDHLRWCAEQGIDPETLKPIDECHGPCTWGQDCACWNRIEREDAS